MVSDAPASDFTLHYSWPFKLIGPAIVFLGVAFPLLIRYADQKPLGSAVWVMAIAFVVFGGIMAGYHNRSVSISENAIQSRSRFGRTSMPWGHIARVETKNGKLQLVSRSGHRIPIDGSMVDATAFARELDARFDSAGLPRPRSV